MTTVQIHKLTPPQITALREALPACVATGVLTTSRSIATFTEPDDYTGPVDFSPGGIGGTLIRAALRTEPADARLVKVSDKVIDGTHVKVLDR